MRSVAKSCIVFLSLAVFLFTFGRNAAYAHDGHPHPESVNPFDVSTDELGPEQDDVDAEQVWLPLDEPGKLGREPVQVPRAAAATDPQLYGAWEGPYDWPVIPIHANLMPNGQVLAWDGYYDDMINLTGWGWPQAVQDKTNVTMWDPATGVHTDMDAELGGNMFCSGHAHLPNGNLFSAGGNVSSGTGRTESHEFDFSTQTWSRNSDLSNARWYPSVTPLSTGEMLVTSGRSSIPEVYDTETGTWRILSNANQSLPLFPWLQPAPNGKVFLAGPNQTMRELNTAGLGDWTTVGQRDTLNRSYGALATVDVGTVLAIGGAGSSASTVLIDMDTGNVTPSGSLNTGRRQHNATILADGSVLVTGGNFNGASLYSEAGGVYSAELWNPDTGQWTLLASMTKQRQYHSTALLLPDGRVLSGGGGRGGGSPDEFNVEIFSPPYLFNADGSAATQPEISSAPGASVYNNTITVSTPNPNNIAKAGFVKLSSVTHSTNFEQRYLPAAINVSAGGDLEVTTPAGANVAPPGFYMLFIVDNNGVPSKAHMIQLVDGSNVQAVIDVTEANTNSTYWFDGSNSIEASSAIIQYDWDFGDGTMASGQTVRHTFATGGDFTVSLTVTDGANRTNTTSITQSVAEPVNLAYQANATQSSTYANSTADLAVDGSTNGDGDAVIAHTNFENEAWWEVDLGKVYDLTTISIWNRTDCCDYRLSDFYTFASEEPFSGTAVADSLSQSGVSNYFHAGPADVRTDIAINRSARYLRIQLTGAHYLQLAEVIVRGDLSAQPNGADALLAEYRLDDNPLSTEAGGVPDATGNHPGSGQNGANTSFDSPAIAGNEGTCRYGQFDGSGQGIVVPYSEALNPRDFTIAFWARVDGGNSSWRSPVSTRYNTPDYSVRKGYNVYAGSNNKWQLWTGDGQNGWDVLTGPDVVNGEWVHVAATFEATTALGEGRFEGSKRLFINGVAVEQTGIYKPNEEVDLTIGMLSSSFGYFNGAIDEVRIYNYSLPTPQILAMMTEGHACNVNEAPVASFGTGATATSFEVAFDGSFSNDADGNIITYDWLFGDGNIGNGATVNHIYDAAGTYTVQLTVTDDDGDTDTMTQQVTAQQANTPPVLDAIDNQSGLRGTLVSIQPTANDADNDDLTWSATGLPNGIAINSSTGEISGTPNASGTFNVTVYVNDGRNGVDSAVFSWALVDPDQVAITPISSLPKQVGVSVPFSAEVTGGSNLTFRWNFGDGSATTSYSSSPNRSHTFSNPGRYLVTLTVRNFDNSTTNYQFVQAVYAAHSTVAPARSSSIIVHNGEVWNVNPDNRTITVIDEASQNKVAEIAVGLNPVALTVAPNGRLWVVNKDSATINVINMANRSVINTFTLPRGSQPHGLVFFETRAYVVLEATGQLLRLRQSDGLILRTLDIGAHPRHISADSSGKLYITRFITPLVPGETTGNPQVNNGGAEIVMVNSSNVTLAGTMTLAHSNAPDTQASGRGIPNYLGAMAIAPDGATAWVASKQDNIARGTLRDGNPLDHDNTVRAIASFVDMNTGAEVLGNRLDFDNAGVASQATFGAFGNYAFVSLETNREIVILDAYARTIVGRVGVGVAPQGMAISADGETLYVHNFVDRSVSVVNLSDLMGGTNANAFVNGTVGTVANEVLPADVLLGKSLFYDAADERLAAESYVSCASCHNAGDSDGRVWDFTGFDEGLRNTISLVGRGGPEHGMLHWTANFDEFHDFEGQIRSFALGTGLMSDGDFANTSDTLGAPKAGLSNELDALAAYMQSLGSFGQSPYRDSNGQLSADAQLGSVVFETQNCAACHGGAGFTDSASAQRHDVGTLKATSGLRMGGTLDGLDTPTLRGLWMTAPYLHDGSAETVADAIAAHNGVNLNATELAQLEAYLLQIDDSEAAPASGNGGSCEEQGLLHEWWNNVPGGSIDLLRNHALYPNNPDGSQIITKMEIPANVNENYGVRLRGYIIAPETGNYRFWLASDDFGELWLSSDDTAANATRIAEVFGWTYEREWDKYPSQASGQIALRAGEKYYIEALMKEYGGGDNLAVAWETPSVGRTVLAGDALCALERIGDPPDAQLTASTTSGDAPLAINFGAGASTDTDGTIVSYDWDFGDGATGSGSNVSHTYTQPGVFTAKLTITDNDGLTDIASVNVTVAGSNPGCGVSGSLLMEMWTGINGTALSDLTSHADYPYHPTSSNQISDFVIPSNDSDRYGVRVRGYIVAPVTGSYTFWIASDDAGSLLLSTSDDPAAATEIAFVDGWTFPEQWEKYGGQKSAEITLQAGQTYYIEALMKEGAGGDNLAVAWQTPGGVRQIIPSPNLCSYEIGNTPPEAQLNASTTVGEAPLNVSFNATGSTDAQGPIASYLWTFHDGSTSTNASTSYVYNTAGIYQVTLTVTDNEGLTDTEMETIVVTNSGGGGDCSLPGVVNREVWTEIWSGEVSELTSSSRFPLNPDRVETQTNFVAPSNIDDVYGVRMRAYLVAPETGTYRFYLASDNEGQVWLSTDDNPANKVQIAQNWWSPEQNWALDPSENRTSAEITLAAGQAYYIEGLHAASWSTDYFAVAWTTPSSSTPTIIPSDAFCAFDPAAAGNRTYWSGRSGTYDVMDLMNSSVVQAMPISLHDDMLAILQADPSLQTRAVNLRTAFINDLNANNYVMPESIADVQQLYSDVLTAAQSGAEASPELATWMESMWADLPLSVEFWNSPLLGMTAPEALDAINAAADANTVPTAISLATLTVGNVLTMLQAMLFGLVLVLTVAIVRRRTRQM